MLTPDDLDHQGILAEATQQEHEPKQVQSSIESVNNNLVPVLTAVLAKEEGSYITINPISKVLITKREKDHLLRPKVSP